MMNKKIYIIGAVVIIIIITAAIFLIKGTKQQTHTPVTSTENTKDPKGKTVEIKNFSYAPNLITVKVGTHITWKNNDTAPHSVTSDDGIFDSGTFNPGESGTVTFPKKGTFNYHCSLHPNMKATVVVE